VVVATLPASRVPTLYARIGDLLVYAGFPYMAALALILFLTKRRSMQTLR